MIPRSLSAIWAAIAPTVANHLWQSTLFAVAAAILALVLRRNQARVRYGLWLAAAVKFLIPFALLVSLGGHLARPRGRAEMQTGLYSAMEVASQPFTQSTAPVISPAASSTDHLSFIPLLPAILAAVWLCGFVAVLLLWWRRWRRISAAMREAAPLREGREVDALRRLERIGGVRKPIALFLSRDSLEPGIFGIVRPVLLWPAGISEHLQDTHLEAILAHEVWHVRRRDNLAAAVHMVVEAIFWFHPLVWWMGGRLVEERERACDEEVLQICNRPQAYAESILKVCEFCVGSPLACVSGVTGADLKKRIAQIMTERVARKLDLKLLLGVAVSVVFGLVLADAAQSRAQSAKENAAQGIAGTWQGTLHAGRDLRTVLKISKADGGGWKALFYSIDQGSQGIPATAVTLQGSTFKFSIGAIDGSYEGKLSADGVSISGTWTQGPGSLPLNFKRATSETAWAMPEPPPRLAPMAADANPEFEVATIKPSNPDKPGKAFMVRGRHFSTFNTSLRDLITFAYGLHPRQIVGGPAWLGSDKYDIEAEPDGEGQPNDKQWKLMVQKLLADRFQLKFHHEKQELSVYALVVAKNGPKLTKSEGDPNGLPGLFFRGLGVLPARNATMADFAGVMQTAVLDRPVVDQTGLKGRFDFELKWTPDESQFGGLGVRVPPPSDSANAPPGLFTAIQEELGLKLESTKAPVEVLVIDHVEKPSAN